MPKKLKTTLAAAGLSATSAGVGMLPVPPQPLTINDWRDLTATYTHEIEAQGRSINLEGINGNLLEKLNDKLDYWPVAESQIKRSVVSP